MPLSRMNSDPARSKKFNRDFDQSSIFISGNIFPKDKPVDDCYSDEDSEEEDFRDAFGEEVNQTTSEGKIRKADDILFKQFGVRVLETVAGCLLDGKMDKMDLIVQALAYRCQKILRGKSGIRYDESWGMYWCGIRTLLRGRALVPFLDHFDLPTKLSKYKEKILDHCGLDSESLGNSGLHVQNTNLWLSGRKEEIGEKTLCVSVSFDGKKIAMSSEGHEDMGGISGDESKKQVDSNYEEEKTSLLSLWKNDDRQSLYLLYDALSSSGKRLVEKLSAIDVLITKTEKQVEKNSNLAKYIFVLKQQSTTGIMLIKWLGKLQFKVCQLISCKRKSSKLLSDDGNLIDLGTQANYFRLQKLNENDDSKISQKIIELQSSSNVLHFPWSEVKEFLSRPIEKLPRSSTCFKKIVESCQLFTTEVFEACGLSQVRPLKEMQNLHQRVHDGTPCIEPKSDASLQSLASFSSNFGAMTFGNNCKIVESGLYCLHGMTALPDIIVKDMKGELEYIVIFKHVEINTFNVTTEMVATCIASSHVSKPSKGCLLVLFSSSIMVIYSLSLAADLVEAMFSFIKLYLNASKCLKKRSKEQCEEIVKIKTGLTKELGKMLTLGTYPVIEDVVDSCNEGNAVVVQNEYEMSSGSRNTTNLVKPDIEQDLISFLDDLRKYMAKQARELIVCNVSDMSGNPSKFPHTILAASFLSSASLKLVIETCLSETKRMIESHPSSAKVLNIGCDGESLHLVTRTKGEQPGTLLALVKHLFKLIKSYKKQDLALLISKNPKINIIDENDEIEEIEEECLSDPPGDVAEFLTESIAKILNDTEIVACSLEDIEDWLTNNISCPVNPFREEKCKKMKKMDLCLAAVKYILPKARMEWLSEHYGSCSISIVLSTEQFEYSPSTVFEKSAEGHFTTVSFDMAHLSNLLREALAKNKLSGFGLSRLSMQNLSLKEGFSYLRKLISISGSKLEFDPMNQKASSLCFSEKTEKGLEEMGDIKGSRLCNLLRQGIMEALDETGIPSESRVRNIYKLKCFLDEKTDPVQRLQRPDKENISNELLQMLLCSLDSHIVTFLNLSHFNARRKSTLTCEQFFGMMTMMADGGRKLDCRQISDILERCTISNALRMTPSSVKGFHFLSKMKVHMTSYEAEPEDEAGNANEIEYPILTPQKRIVIPSNSLQDQQSRKRKRSNTFPGKVDSTKEVSSSNVRRFTKKF